MKKTYIIPEVQLIQVGSETLLSESLGVDGSKTVTGTNGGWVKEDRGSSRPGYNVWNDDWSK